MQGISDYQGPWLSWKELWMMNLAEWRGCDEVLGRWRSQAVYLCKVELSVVVLHPVLNWFCQAHWDASSYTVGSSGWNER